MKRCVLLLFLIVILASALASAEYGCSDNNTISESRKRFEVRDSNNVNGLIMILMDAEESVLRLSASLNVGGDFISLSDSSPDGDIDIGGEIHNITLINMTDDDTKISIDGTSGTIDLDETSTVAGFEVFISDREWNGQSTMSANIYVGEMIISLASDGDLSKIVTINEIEYLVELSSASDTDAVIVVGRCENASIVEIEEVVVNDSVQNDTVVNDTIMNNTEVNDTVVNDTIVNDSVVNESVGGGILNGTNSTNIGDGDSGGLKRIYVYILIVPGVLIVGAIVFFLFMRARNSPGKEKKEEKKEVEVNDEEEEKSINSFGGVEVVSRDSDGGN